MSDLDNLEENWNLFKKICEKTGDRSAAISGMLEALGERIILAPSRAKIEWTTSKPGGLVEHSLGVFKNARALSKSLNIDISIESLIITSLFHDLGKIGDAGLESGGDYFIDQDSDWHREKLGQVYKYNPDIQKMSHPHRSLMILQTFGVTLNEDEWLAILTSGGPGYDENRFYSGTEPSLGIVIQMAVRAANLQEWIGTT